MTRSREEHVLVVPTARLQQLGVFQGFCPRIETYLPALLDPAHLRFLPRSAAENDPSFKQLIPYIVLRCGTQVFHYTRGQAGGEARLRALRSLGVGGHISDADGDLTGDLYRAGMQREIGEEVDLSCAYTERMVGLINDDATPVGRVHLGVVHVFDLAEPQARRREEALTACGFAPVAELRRHQEEFETWSQFLLGSDGLLG
jgi:predicted NUDIX family phosphoesterase